MPPHTSGGRSCLPPCPRSSVRSTMWGPCPSAKTTKSRYCSSGCWKVCHSWHEKCKCVTYCMCGCCYSGGPWTLQRPADWQSGAGLQEEIRHLHRACAEGEGQRNHSPCRHPPQQGEAQLCRMLKPVCPQLYYNYMCPLTDVEKHVVDLASHQYEGRLVEMNKTFSVKWVAPFLFIGCPKNKLWCK